MHDFIVTVMARDRVGILRDVSAALAGLQGNITHASQTVLRGYFTLILSVQTPDAVDALQVKQQVTSAGFDGEFAVGVRHAGEDSPPPPARNDLFTLSIRSREMPGVVRCAAEVLARRAINIEDFSAYALDDEFIALAVIAIPPDVSLPDLRRELITAGEQFGFSVHIMHADVFRATGDIRPVRFGEASE